MCKLWDSLGLDQINTYQRLKVCNFAFKLEILKFYEASFEIEEQDVLQVPYLKSQLAMVHCERSAVFIVYILCLAARKQMKEMVKPRTHNKQRDIFATQFFKKD